MAQTKFYALITNVDLGTVTFGFITDAVYDATKTILKIVDGGNVYTIPMNGIIEYDFIATDVSLDWEITLYDTGGVLVISGTGTALFETLFEAAINVLMDLNNTMKLNLSWVHNAALFVVSTLWDFGDGHSSTVIGGVSHEYLMPGSYTVTLTLTSQLGRVSVGTIPVVVGPSECAKIIDVNFFMKECHEYMIHIPMKTEDTRGIVIKDLNDNVILSQPIVDPVTEVLLSSPGDGVYMVTLDWDPGSGTREVYAEYPVFDMCEIKRCYKVLLDASLCSDTSGEGDDCEAKNNDLATRNDLNSLSGLIYFANEYIRKDIDTHYGMTAITESRTEEIYFIASLIEQMKLFISNCSICSQLKDEDCTNCKN